MGSEDTESSADSQERSRWTTDAQERRVDLGELWPSFAFGACVVVEHFFSKGHCHAVLRRRQGQSHRPSQPQRELLRRLVLGQQQKAIALELGTSSAAVSLMAQRCIRHLGLSCRLPLLPLILIASGVAFYTRPRMAVQAHVTRRLAGGGALDVCSFARPDECLPGALSEAEQAVTRLLVEGGSQAAIAARRGTTARTVGNQIGAIFAKLGVSGRLDLIQFLVKRSFTSDP